VLAGAFGRRRLGTFAIVVGDRVPAQCALPQDQNDDHDDEDEEKDATTDVDTGCEKHAQRLPVARRSQTPSVSAAAWRPPVSGSIVRGTRAPSNLTEGRWIMGTNADQAKGRVKQAAGDLTDDPDLKREGKADEMEGKAKEKVDQLRDKADEWIDRGRDKLDDRK
jgi:uncharacterized protein YjbJ (UPF0337 family)